MINDIKGVIFDLDGTLIDSMWVWEEIDVEFLGKRGLELPDDLQRKIEGMSFTETAGYFKERFKLKESIDEIKAEWDEMTLHYFNEKVVLKKGVKDLLEVLKSKNLKIGIATSNTRERTTDILKKYNLFHYFDAIRTSCEVDRGKPFPDVYLQAAKDLGLDPSTCLAFEDTYAGVLAAKRAGMKVCAVHDKASLDYKSQICEVADRYLDNINDIA
ncbi:HAD family hydrolase [Sporosalibacterium faouarense]|uniref:HAD family hydrolase n=1 Tax=Sporosalibacterium faouarense TaxID=516123 RepID=UPI00141C872D|nr:HAD family phosphatase [Sporosalibacterium faouarense]MTI47673.1 HAD family phosphatase [Bacillota bacterium]